MSTTSPSYAKTHPINLERQEPQKDNTVLNQSDFSQPNTTGIRPETPQEDAPIIIASKCEIATLAVLESHITTAFMTLLTIYALFGDDLRMCAFEKKDDDIFFGLAVVCLFFFSAELIASFIIKPDYRWNFYFWLDFISTISLIPDIGWIWYPMVGIDEEGGSDDAEQIQNAGKASRAGTRTSRVIRVIRLIRIVKLYKNAQMAMKQQQEDDQVMPEQKEITIPAESKVGKKLSDLTTKRVIVLTLIMLIMLPLFETDFYLTAKTSWDYGLQEVMAFHGDEGFEVVRQEYIIFHEDAQYPIIYFSYDINGEWTWEGETNHEDLRTNEKHYATDDFDSVAIFDLREETRLSAGLNIAKTIFVCIVLTLGAIYFTKDANELVITPIEKMVDKVKKIAKNPITASEDKSKTVYDLQTESSSCFGKCSNNKKETNGEYETELLENTITKIGTLLALGFGEAGAAIIGTNIEQGGDVDPMLEGKKMMAVFGFCYVLGFAETTEILQEDIMVFVNEIALIVHSNVDHFQGAANKNIGEAFLLVWKFEDEDVFVKDDEMMLNPESQRAQFLPDCAFTSFLKIIAKVNRSPMILKYRQHAKLTKVLPNYYVKMGFGLHIGWGIEGAIGSEFKIDASYLSPNVNLASRLEAATNQYGVPILISGEVYDKLSAKAQSLNRHIDTVNVKGSKKEMRLYTSDCQYDELTPSKNTTITKEQSRQKRRVLRRKLERGEIYSWHVLENSKELKAMRNHLTQEFLDAFQNLMNSYIGGNWQEAKWCIDQCFRLKPRDGPTQTLSNVMSETNFIAPPGWKGVRALTEK